MAESEQITPEMIAARLAEIATKFWSLWIWALGLFFVNRWFGSVVATVLLTSLLLVLAWKLVVPCAALWVLYGRIDGFGRAVRNNVLMAFANLILVGYSGLGIWLNFPFVWAALLLSSVVSLANLSAGGGRSA